ncbi:hypothetical protein ACFX2A_004294 [Malus domestica]
MSEPCVVAWNAMIDGFGKNGEMGYAVLLFESMPERDVKIRGWKGHCVSSKCNCIPPRLYFSLVAVFVRILVIMLKNSAEKNENKKKRKD